MDGFAVPLLGGSLVDRWYPLKPAVTFSPGLESVMDFSSVSMPDSKEVDMESVWNDVLGVLEPVDGIVLEDASETELLVLNDRAKSAPSELFVWRDGPCIGRL